MVVLILFTKLMVALFNSYTILGENCLKNGENDATVKKQIGLAQTKDFEILMLAAFEPISSTLAIFRRNIGFEFTFRSDKEPAIVCFCTLMGWTNSPFLCLMNVIEVDLFSLRSWFFSFVNRTSDTIFLHKLNHFINYPVLSG